MTLTYQRSAQQLRTGPRGRVLLHVLNKPISFGVAGQLAVNQEGALDVSVGAHHLLELLRGEGVRQVGEAEQRVGGLQGDVDQASANSAVVEGADGILSLVPVQQSHKGWRRGQHGDGATKGKRRTRDERKPGRKRCVETDGGERGGDQRRRTVKAHIQKTGRRQFVGCRVGTHSQINAKGKSGGEQK